MNRAGLVIVAVIATAACWWLGGVVVTFACWLVWAVAYEMGRIRGRADGWREHENARRQP